MIAKRHVRRRLGQYGALWLGSFVLTLIVTAAMVFGVGVPLAETADMALPVAFGVLGVLVIVGIGLTLVRDVGLSTKLVVTTLALVLILPLLWAPVLAVVVSAALAGASVEYSTAYAGFRIVVSRLIYPLASLLGEDPLIGLLWQGFQVVASIVGAVASIAQVLRVIRPYLYDDEEAEEPS